VRPRSGLGASQLGLTATTMPLVMMALFDAVVREAPIGRYDEPMIIRKNMNITCHPTWLSAHLFNTICDNYLIGDNGVAEHLHKYPEKLIELG
jgi:hypothetical protein